MRILCAFLFLIFAVGCSGVPVRQSASRGLFQRSISDDSDFSATTAQSEPLFELPTGPTSGRSADGFIWPLKSGKISSYFGKRKRDFHDGIDISAPRGTIIQAAKDGVVIYSSRKIRGYGNMVVLKHSDRTYSVYAHCQKTLVQRDMVVKQGQVIAKVGSTGKSTGPHLHFEIRKGQVPFDPIRFLPNVSYAQTKKVKQVDSL